MEKVVCYLDELIERYPILECNRDSIWQAFECLRKSYENGGKLLIAGNGGSCADAEHIVGELMKGFVKERSLASDLQDRLTVVDSERGAELAKYLQQALPAIALSNHQSLNTAFQNDLNAEMMYAQQVIGYGKKNDVFLGISTSGNSKNIIYAAIAAKAIGLPVIGLTSHTGKQLGDFADIVIGVSESETFKIQELHLPIYHCICLMLEMYFFE